MVLYYLEAVVMKHWLPPLIGFLGSIPWWGRALLSEHLQNKIDKYLNPSNVKIAAIIVISLSFIWANFNAWVDERKQVNNLEKTLGQERAAKKPELNAPEFGFLSTTNAIIRNNKGCMAVFEATIANAGAPTTAGNFEVSIKIGDRELAGIPLVMSERLNLGVKGKQAFTFTRNDYLPLKCSEFIIAGKPVYGIYPIFFQGLLKTDLLNEGLPIKLSFKDASMNQYVFEQRIGPNTGDGLGPLRLQEIQELP